MAQSKSRKNPDAAPFIDRGESLPRSYGLNRITALVRDPEHIFVYWDIEGEIRAAGVPLVIRIACLSDGQTWDLQPGAGVDNWYFQLTPNRTYLFELFARRSGGLVKLAASRETTTPVRWAGESGEYAPAELIHAERHPLTRGRPRPVRKGAALPAAEIPKAPPVPPPHVVTPPPVRAFSVSYARGKE